MGFVGIDIFSSVINSRDRVMGDCDFIQKKTIYKNVFFAIRVRDREV